MKCAWDILVDNLGFESCTELYEKFMPPIFAGELIYHYTSSSGLQSILKENPDKLILRASRFDCLNDKMEGTFARKIFINNCNEMYHKGEIDKDLHSILVNTSPTKTTLFYNVGGRRKPIRINREQFLTSLSQDGDSLAMWKYYSKGTQYDGRNIGLLTSEITNSLKEQFWEKEASFSIFPVVYREEEQKELITGFINLIKEAKKYNQDDKLVRALVSEQLAQWALVFKSQHFSHEEEVRIVIDVGRTTKNGVLQGSPIPIKYRDSNGYIIPFIELNLSKNSLESVTLAPIGCEKEMKDIQKTILEDMLCRYGYSAKGYNSGIDMRY